jgi:hypothetical protein
MPLQTCLLSVSRTTDMRVAYFGTRERGYPRNEQVLAVGRGHFDLRSIGYSSDSENGAVMTALSSHGIVVLVKGTQAP